MQSTSAPLSVRPGRNDLSLTVFVPWDCGNNCAFCTTKREYAEVYNDRDLDELCASVASSIAAASTSYAVNNVVFTGGEPFADLPRLAALMEAVAPGKRVFVNTSLHVRDRDEVLSAVKSGFFPRLNGISVSAHLNAGFRNEEAIAALKRFGDICDFRVNALVTPTATPDEIDTFVGMTLDDTPVTYVNFRADYRHITQATLGSCEDPFFQTLMQMPRWNYRGHSGCLVCRSDDFETPHGKVNYHRGTESTALRFGDTLVVHDLVVKQDGELRYDWQPSAKVDDLISAHLGFSLPNSK